MKSSSSSNELRQLLPWYENGTLHAREREAVRALLASDLEAHRQRRELRALRDAVIDDSTLASNMGANLQRVHARIRPHRALGYVPITTHRLAFAAFVILVLGVATFFAGARMGPYRTLSAPVDIAPAGVELIRVDVASSVDAATLVELAGDPNAQVLRGPSEQGVATLAVPRGHTSQVMARLRADPRLRFVAPAAH